VVWVFDDTSGADNATVPRSFFEPIRTGTNRITAADKMLFIEKFLRNADLIISFRRCSFGKPVTDCPFVKFWTVDETEEQEEPILTIPDNELDSLREFHRKCMLKQIERVQEEYFIE
jgi:hypothetical protein